jgi:hypothetical protein
VQALMTERARWQDARTDVVVPIVLTALGVVAVVGCFGLVAYSGDDHDPAAGVAGAALGVAGAGSLITALVLWSTRTSESRKSDELQRIDNQLQLYGVRASLSPWFVPRTAQRAGASGGLTLSLQL